MKWHIFKTMWAAILTMIVLRSATAGWSAKDLQTLDLSGIFGSPRLLRGAIPNAVGSWSKLRTLMLRFQGLSGRIPHAVGSMTKLVTFLFPGGTSSLEKWAGQMRGAIPDAVGSWLKMTHLNIMCHSLNGPIPHVVGSLDGPCLATGDRIPAIESDSIPKRSFVIVCWIA